MKDRIAVIVPTSGKREDWLQLLNRHYSAQSDKVRIHIARGGLGPYDGIGLMLDEVQAKYVTYCGDDDFHFTEHLHEMADFLDRHPDCPGAYGDGLLMGLDNFRINWSVNYPMVWERSYSLSRRHVFADAVHAARQLKGFGRDAMNRQAWRFNEEYDLHGQRMHIPGFQFIHGHHLGRDQEKHDPAWRRFIEMYGGGWLASWLPSRSGSLRAIRRGFNPNHEHYLYMKQLLEDFRADLPVEQLLQFGAVEQSRGR